MRASLRAAGAAGALAVAAVLALPVLDATGAEPAAAAWAARASPAAVEVAWTLHEVGEPHWAAVLAVLAGLALWWRGRGAEAVAVPAAVGATLAGVMALKAVVARARPAGAAVAGADAFPSGHAAAAAVLAVLAVAVAARALKRRALVALVAVAAGLWALAMGGSRLVLQQHRLGDVVVGMALGACAGLLFPLLLDRLEALREGRVGRLLWARAPSSPASRPR